MKIISKFLLLLGCSIVSAVSYGQIENNQDVFDEFMNRNGNQYRTASGKPGPAYFQNEADYKIKVRLNPENHSLEGQIIMTYINNSPQDLDYIWMFLEQNRFTENSRGTLTTPAGGNRYVGDTGKGVKITNLESKVRRATSTKHLINDTRMQVFFDQPLKAEGGKAEVSMNFEFKIPVDGMDRMGRLSTKNGEIYALAQWFPQVAVFDDIQGWNIEPYLGAGEFYYDYGDFEVEVTVPHDYLVVASGELLNPKDVMSDKLYNRYEKAQNSEETVYLIKPEEIGDASLFAKSSGTQTWEFQIENSRDFAFSASKAFIWDAAKINLQSGEDCLAQSAYPIESDGQDAWSRSTEYSKASVEHYSEMWFEYPYPAAVNVAADIGGMEYPGLNFCSWQSKGASLWGVTDHEFGHNWFPMIVGSNERRYAWMDEGFNTFINYYSTLAFNDGEYPARLGQPRNLTGWFLSDEREGIDTYPDVANLRNLGMIAYYKPALGLIMLREYILGEERFDFAFRSYIETWAYKHPQPKDFFNHMENAAGENLNWFFGNWFYGTGNIDLAIDSLRERNGEYFLTVSNNGEVPMPVKMKITYQDGTTSMKTLPVEIWQRGNTWTHKFTSDKTIQSIEIDPDKILPDVNYSNDKWPVNLYKD
ncbi:M1 family metallopeptidase [Psychroflexus aestuariivivens]|uniref:M1 family metallopeptidase n=1 Tax=Psychroflexus aestuariivivens TaxID=1795040 RepID=UPI000FD75B51|nr:M1 family metallopeptidase [Psychroflexus aestuariivivens]